MASYKEYSGGIITEIRPVAYIENDYTDKFAIPRQSGLSAIKSRIVFEKDYADTNALRGIEGFSHLWLIWGFSKNIKDKHSLTVRPPRLGGNVRLGVFATRSPFRPNNLGLSCVKLEGIENGSLIVSGADLMNGTPIYDIKPYVKYSDSIENAVSGFTDETPFNALEVEFNTKTDMLSAEQLENLRQILKNDPRPAYHSNEERVYGFGFAGFEIKFRVEGGTLYVLKIENG